MDDGLAARLTAWFRARGRVVVALSGGVDSTLLADVAREALGDDALAVTGASASLPVDERDGIAAWCAARGLRHVVVDTHELDDPRYARNDPDRCYHCKHELFTRLARFVQDARATWGAPSAAGEPAIVVVEGTHADDLRGHRPGRRAADELGVRSPYVELGVGKDAIRALARARGLPNAERPSSPCLSSRIAYGVAVTPARLERVRAGERALDDLGFSERRVRLHGIDGGELARVEVPKRDLPRAIESAAAIDAALRAVGFTYATIDLRGLRSGSLLEVFDGTPAAGARS
jgi:pyridinium-3,5-biscarboxylic acid mononucleotide sulfurtransferase